MKKYRVNVNGSLYEVEIEEMQAPATMSAAKPAAAAPAPAAAGAGAKVNAPMPGTILDVRVQNGAKVKKGDVLVILEAMKMENQIQAPCDGTVTSVCVKKGDSVETQALICTIA
ncbi:MAG: biotin/lipoyl-binding protein [Firmicutes bacterium]|nr:biotin/lipoyl-binding protein [Bacillota bacterium]